MVLIELSALIYTICKQQEHEWAMDILSMSDKDDKDQFSNSGLCENITKQSKTDGVFYTSWGHTPVWFRNSW